MEERFLATFSKNYKIIEALFGESMNISQLAVKTNLNKGTISKIVKCLEILKIVKSHKGKTTRGNPWKVVELTPISISIILALREHFKDEETDVRIDSEEFDHYIGLIEGTDDERLQEEWADALENLSRKYRPQGDENILTSIHEKLNQEEYAHIRKNLLRILLNIVSNAEDEALTRISNDFRQPIQYFFGKDYTCKLGVFYLTADLTAKLNTREEGYMRLMRKFEENLCNPALTYYLFEIVRKNYPEKRREFESKLEQLAEKVTKRETKENILYMIREIPK